MEMDTLPFDSVYLYQAGHSDNQGVVSVMVADYAIVMFGHVYGYEMGSVGHKVVQQHDGKQLLQLLLLRYAGAADGDAAVVVADDADGGGGVYSVHLSVLH